MADTPNVPLVVDLDGTVIRTDMMWESLAALLRRNPLAIFQILYWWSRGRAWLKQKLVARVQIDPATLPYHERFRDWLRKEKESGRKIILATASDRAMAEPIAACLGLFDEIMASDGVTNLRRENKRLALVKRFGERGFDYAGNSPDDLTVWRSARKAIVVNAPPAVLQGAATCAELGPTFCDGYSSHQNGRRFLSGLLWRSGYAVAMAAGVLLALSFPKFSVAGFAWVAPALLLGGAYGKTGGDPFRVGYVGGFTFWLVSLYWLLLMPATGFPILAWIALAAFVALYFGLWTWAISSIAFPESWARRAAWTLGGAATWVALEMVRARLLGGFPWSLLGSSQYQLVPLIQIASVTGVYGVSFLIIWFALAVYSAAVMIVRHPTRRQVWQAEIVLPMAAVVACYVGGFFALNGGTTATSSLRITAIQPNFAQTLIWSEPENARRFQSLLAQSQAALNRETNTAELLVWPESAVPSVDEPTYEAINHFVQSNHIWLILNGEDVDYYPTETNYYNAAFIIGPDGHWRQAYHKRNLVIFGEYVPLIKWLPFMKYLTPIGGGWTCGDKPATFEMEHRDVTESHVIEISTNPVASHITSVTCSPLICFEDTFPGTARDAAQDDIDFLVNLTNDGWFGESAEQRQHLANAVFRAVENGVPLLRCANNGVTCLIDGRGRPESVFRDAQNSEYAAGALTVDIPLLAPTEKSAPTFYNRHGDWFGWACVGITLVWLGRNAMNRKLPMA